MYRAGNLVNLITISEGVILPVENIWKVQAANNVFNGALLVKGIVKPVACQTPISVPFKDISGLPITPANLRRIGFNRTTYRHTNRLRRVRKVGNRYVDIHYCEKDNLIRLATHSDNRHGVDLPMIHIEYIHQIQNLYFQLTNEELPLVRI